MQSRLMGDIALRVGSRAAHISYLVLDESQHARRKRLSSIHAAMNAGLCGL